MGDGTFHRKLSPRESKEIIKTALKNGIRSFDTAFSYHEADSMLRSALREAGKKRDDIEIISKVMPVPSLAKKAEASLRRLGTDHVDVLLLHWPSDDKSIYGSLRKLESLMDSGRCLSIGVSNFPFSLLEKAASDFPIAYHERPLSLIWNKDWEKEKSLNLRTLAYAPLGMGLLSLRYRKQSDLGDCRKDLFAWHSDDFYKLLDYMSTLECSASGAALSWVENEKPYGIIQGAGKKTDIMTESTVLSAEELGMLSGYAERITAAAPSDNIFSHNYATITP